MTGGVIRWPVTGALKSNNLLISKFHIFSKHTHEAHTLTRPRRPPIRRRFGGGWIPTHHVAMTCPHCNLPPDAPACWSRRGSFRCTRGRGHDGPHIACGEHSHNLLEWSGLGDGWLDAGIIAGTAAAAAALTLAVSQSMIL